MLELRQLQVLVSVLDEGGVTRAAESLNLTPGAVSLQLRNLTSQLRTELFVRAGKRLAPTPAALLLAERARAALRSVRAIEEEFENDAERDTRPVRLASGATTLIHRLGRPLRLLKRRYPNAQIQVTVSATEEMVEGLLDRRFDIALISLPYPTPELTIHPLFDEELLIMRPSSAMVRTWSVGSIDPAELGKARFLLYHPRSNMRQIINAFFRDLGITPEVVMEADDTVTIRGMVECGFGYSILPELALRRPPRFFQAFRVPGHRIVRRQALAKPRQIPSRALTEAIALVLRAELSAPA